MNEREQVFKKNCQQYLHTITPHSSEIILTTSKSVKTLLAGTEFPDKKMFATVNLRAHGIPQLDEIEMKRNYYNPKELQNKLSFQITRVISSILSKHFVTLLQMADSDIVSSQLIFKDLTRMRRQELAEEVINEFINEIATFILVDLSPWLIGKKVTAEEVGLN